MSGIPETIADRLTDAEKIALRGVRLSSKIGQSPDRDGLKSLVQLRLVDMKRKNSTPRLTPFGCEVLSLLDRKMLEQTFIYHSV